MARSSDYYILYQTWAKVRRGQLVEQINNQRQRGWPDKAEKDVYRQVTELSLYIWALESFFVGNLTALEADVIIDRIIELTETTSTVQFDIYPAVATINIEDGTGTSSLFTVANRFTALTDTFASYTGKANQFLQVNGGQTGITSKALAATDSAYTPGAVGSTLTATNVDTALTQIDGNVLANGTSITTINTWKGDVDSTGTGIVVKFANSPTNPRYIKRTITQSTNISVTNGDGVSGNPTIATTLTPSFTTVTTTGNATIGGNIIVTGLVDGIDVSIADGLNLKRAGGQNTMSQDINMSAVYFVMNMPAAVANGQATRYEQVVRTTSDQAGITGIKEFTSATKLAGGMELNNVPLATTLTVEIDRQLIKGDGYAINGTLVVDGDFFIV